MVFGVGLVMVVVEICGVWRWCVLVVGSGWWEGVAVWQVKEMIVSSCSDRKMERARKGHQKEIITI